MTNLELAQQQGNQAAPNLLNAAIAGELGGGGSVFPSLSTAGFVIAELSFTLNSDQADEAVANTIYANCKLVTDNHLDVFMFIEEYTDGSVDSEPSHYTYLAFSARTLARIKNLVALEQDVPTEFLEILNAIEPDELFTFDSPDTLISLIMFAGRSAAFGIDELPPYTSGFIHLTFEQPSTDVMTVVPPIPEGSSAYALAILPVCTPPSADIGLFAISYYAESLLDTPTKLDKTYYTLAPEPEPEP